MASLEEPINLASAKSAAKRKAELHCKIGTSTSSITCYLKDKTGVAKRYSSDDDEEGDEDNNEYKKDVLSWTKWKTTKTN